MRAGCTHHPTTEKWAVRPSEGRPSGDDAPRMCSTPPTAGKDDSGSSDDADLLDAQRTAAARLVAQKVRDRVTARQLERYLRAPTAQEPLDG